MAPVRVGRDRKGLWCDCVNGPQPAPPKVSPDCTSDFAAASKDPLFWEDPGEERSLAVEDLARITYTFWKPVEIPIDVTVTVTAK